MRLRDLPKQQWRWVGTGYGIPGSGPARTQMKSMNLRNYVVRAQVIESYFIAPPKGTKTEQNTGDF